MNKCQLAKKITHGADKFTLGACHLVWIAVCTKSLNLHLVVHVWQWYKFTHGGSSLYQHYLHKCVKHVHWREPWLLVYGEPIFNL